MDYKKNIEDADEMSTDELFERLNDNERIELLFEQMENTYDIIFQLEQRVEHLDKKRKIDYSLIEMLLENDDWYSKQLGGHGERPELLDRPAVVEALKKKDEPFVAKKRIDFYTKKEICAAYEWSSKTFERPKQKGEIKVTTFGSKDYVLIEDMHARFKQGR